MNSDYMRRVADLIELEDRFDLSTWAGLLPGRNPVNAMTRRVANLGADVRNAELIGELCDTTGCIAGWTVAAARLDEIEYAKEGLTTMGAAGNLLDLDQVERWALFFGDSHFWKRMRGRYGFEADEDGFVGLSSAVAAKVLRDIASGEVNLIEPEDSE